MSKPRRQAIERAQGEKQKTIEKLSRQNYQDITTRALIKNLQHVVTIMDLLANGKEHEFFLEVKRLRKGQFSDAIFETQTIRKYALSNYGDFDDYFVMKNFRRGMDKHIETVLFMDKGMSREEIAFFLCNKDSVILSEMAQEEKTALRYKRLFISTNAEKIKTETLSHMEQKKKK